MGNAWEGSRQIGSMVRLSRGAFGVISLITMMTLGGCAGWGTKGDVDAPEITDFKVTPSAVRVGEPITYTFTILSTKAPIKTVVLEWVRTAPKRWNPGPREIKAPQRFIKNNGFSYTAQEGKYISYGAQLSVYSVSVYVIDELGRKSSTLSVTVKQE